MPVSTPDEQLLALIAGSRIALRKVAEEVVALVRRRTGLGAHPELASP